MKVLINNFEFINGVWCSGKIFGQEIVLKEDNNVIVGALMHKRAGLLEDVKIWYQVCAPEDHASMFDWSNISEDEGYIFGCFDFNNDQKFLDYVNQYRLVTTE